MELPHYIVPGKLIMLHCKFNMQTITPTLSACYLYRYLVFYKCSLITWEDITWLWRSQSIKGHLSWHVAHLATLALIRVNEACD